jgi:hypothetical protein
VANESVAAADLGQPSAWGISYQMHGNPGAANGPVFSAEFTGWRHQNFTAAELADSTISGYAAAPNGDGVSNLLRFSMGLGADGNAHPRLPSAAWNAGQWEFTFHRLKRPIGISYQVCVSADLQSWEPAATTPVSITDLGDGSERVVVRINAGAAGRKYATLKVTMP